MQTPEPFEWFLIALGVLLVAALGIALWLDVHSGPPAPCAAGTIERRTLLPMWVGKTLILIPERRCEPHG